MKNLLSISVVIPAYNEESRIKDCLKALMTQTVPPYEIIVVNNNCTDKTVKIASEFKGITIVKEFVQGRAPARDCGFNYATGDILARFDADTILPPNWIERVGSEFAKDPILSGLSGYGVARVGAGIPKVLWSAMSHMYSWVYNAHCRAFFGAEIMWGGNMAIRRSTWLKIKKLCISLNDNIHEDQDISLALASVGGKVKTIPSLVVSVDFYEIEHFGKIWRYNKMKRRNRRLHNVHPRSRLRTMRKISWPKRLGYYLVSSPLEFLYFVLAAYNSVRRYIVNRTKLLFAK